MNNETRGVFVPWDDPDETPLECIKRLNDDVIEKQKWISRQLDATRAERDQFFAVGNRPEDKSGAASDILKHNRIPHVEATVEDYRDYIKKLETNNLRLQTTITEIVRLFNKG